MLKFHAGSIHQCSSNNDSELIKSYSFLPSGFPSRSLKNKEKKFLKLNDYLFILIIYAHLIKTEVRSRGILYAK